MFLWQETPIDIWQGRDDTGESTLAKRIFQTITVAATFTPEKYTNKKALIGFMCDEGVKINKGRVGAFDAPNEIRKSLAWLASFPEHENLVDMGNIVVENTSLKDAQNYLAKKIVECFKSEMKTIVLGGGHETAYGHGLGVYEAFPNAKIGVINLDAHLDLRTSDRPSSGTSFLELANYCKSKNMPFNYMCIGASKATNTDALLKTAKELNVKILWDIDCHETNMPFLKNEIEKFIKEIDIVYFSIDLDVLPISIMPAVSSPSGLGVDLRTVLLIEEIIAKSGKLKAVDIVEYIPSLDKDKLYIRTIGRLLWQICNDWK